MTRISGIVFFLLVHTAFATIQTVDSIDVLHGKVQGSIVDKHSAKALPGVKIQLTGTPYFAVSDTNGKFFFKTEVQIGRYELLAFLHGYSLYRIKDILVYNKKITEIKIEMTENEYSKDEIVVSAKKMRPSDVGNTSVNSFSSQQLQWGASLQDDIQRIAMWFPGVAFSTDRRTDLVIRGGNAIENYFSVDGIEIPNTNHFGLQGSGNGRGTMINYHLMRNVNFSTGGFSVKYGDRTSSVMDIEYKNGSFDKWGGNVEMAFSGAGGVIEIPLFGKGNIIASFKRSYLELYRMIGLIPSNVPLPIYYNGNVKATIELNASHRLELIAIGGQDQIQIADLSNINQQNWQYIIGGIHKWIVNENSMLRSSLSWRSYNVDTRIKQPNQLSEIYKNTSSENGLIFRSDFYTKLWDGTLEAGIIFNYLPTQNSVYDGTIPNSYDKRIEAYKAGAYIQYEKTFFNFLSITAGVRVDYFSYIATPMSISPLLSTKITVADNLFFAATYGLYHQSPPTAWLIAYEGNRNVSQIEAHHFIIGAEYYPIEGMKVSVEGFYKLYNNYPVSIDRPYFYYGNNTGAFGGYVPLVDKIESSGTGYVRGVDVLIYQKLTNWFYASGSYTFYDAKNKAKDGVERNSAFDFQHLFNTQVGVSIPVAENTIFEASASFRLMGGIPYTPLDIVASTAKGMAVEDGTKYLSEKFPLYHRVDIKVGMRHFFSGCKLLWYIDVQNIYNQQTPIALSWDNVKNEVVKIFQYSRIPTIGFLIEF